jgi:hypothetical protein
LEDEMTDEKPEETTDAASERPAPPTTDAPEIGIPASEVVPAPAAVEPNYICIRASDGSLPDVPVEHRAAFGIWFTEMSKRAQDAERQRLRAEAAQQREIAMKAIANALGVKINGHSNGSEIEAGR